MVFCRTGCCAGGIGAGYPCRAAPVVSFAWFVGVGLRGICVIRYTRGGVCRGAFALLARMRVNVPIFVGLARRDLLLHRNICCDSRALCWLGLA